jgi:hypothetical protein
MPLEGGRAGGFDPAGPTSSSIARRSLGFDRGSDRSTVLASFEVKWRSLARAWGFGLGAGLLASWSGCASPGVFACVADDQCGEHGRCEAVGYCSFPDDACDSGRRYAPHSHEKLAGKCVPTDDASDGSSSGTSHGSVETSDESGSTSQSLTSDTSEPTTASASTTIGDDETEADPSSSTGEPQGRVTEGLLVLYRFDEGAGSTLHDVSMYGVALDLELQGSGFSWTSTGLHSDGTGIALAQGSATKIRTACQATNELTIEAWITPAYAGQPIGTQPSRIVTWSLGSSSRNFSLNQGIWNGAGDIPEAFSVRLRTSDSTENGGPYMNVEVSVPTELQHVVYTRRADGVETLHRDAVAIGTQAVKTGDFSTWTAEADHRFALANEVSLSSRGWAGELHLVALYERALTEPEIAQNYEAGLE